MNITLYRFCAKLVDLIGFMFLVIGVNMLMPNTTILLMSILSIFIYIIWFGVIPYKWHATPGKMLLGLKIEPQLQLWQYLVREPLTYFFIAIVISTIILPINQMVGGIINNLVILYMAVMLFLFYFKHEWWNNIFHCQVVEKK